MKSLETKRLIIRAPKPEDFEIIFSIHANPMANIYNPNGPETDRESFRKVFGFWMEHHHKYGFGYYVLVDKADNEAFGITGLRFSVIQDKKYLNLYYRINPSKTRKGFVKEAANEIMRVVLSELNYEYQVVALTSVDNLPSRKTAASLQLVHKPEFDNLGGKGNIYYFSLNKA